MTAGFLHKYPVRNGMRILNQNKKFFIVTCVLELLGIPMGIASVMLLCCLENGNSSISTASVELCYVIAYICASVVVFLGMFFGIHAFKEEWDKPKVDMLYALPINNKQRFFSNYTSGLAMYVIPYMIAVILGWVIFFAMSPFVSAVIDSFQEEFSDICKYYALGSLGLGLLMWMYYTISVLTASCCGTLFENIYTDILLNILIPVVFATVTGSITSNLYDFSFSYCWTFIGYTSPIGGLIYLLVLLTEGDMSSYYYSNLASAGKAANSGLVWAYLRWTAVIVVLTIALLLLAWKLYTHRKAEHVGKPFVYIGIYYVILIAITVCILCIAAVDDDFIVGALIASAIVHFIMEAIRKRGFKKFWKSVICYSITVVVTAASFALIIGTNCFGRINYVPSAASISSVTLAFYDADGSTTIDGYSLIYNDKDTISKVLDFQRTYLKNRNLTDGEYKYYTDIKNQVDAAITGYVYLNYSTDASRYSVYNGGYSYNCDDIPVACTVSNVSITYQTITGTKIHREYNLMMDEYLDLMEICVGTDVYAEATASFLVDLLVDEYSTREQVGDTYTYGIPSAISAFKLYSSYASTYSDYYQAVNLMSASEKFILLQEAYQHDLQKMTFEEYCTSPVFGWLCGVPVYTCCEETRNLLESWGFTEFSVESRFYESYTDNNYILDIRMYAPGTYKTDCLDYPSCSIGSFYFKKNVENAIPVYEDRIINFDDATVKYLSSDMYDLLEALCTHYISAENCYAVVINGGYYLLPEENADLAEAVIANGNDYIFDKYMEWLKS